MAVPKRRTGKSRRDRRRAHHSLTGTNLAKCGNCGAMLAPHRACPSCGYYKGRLVVQVKTA